jgi:hypothetical protein
VSAECGADEPIACSLGTEALADRVEDWRALVATYVVTVDAGPTSVRLVLGQSGPALVRAVELAQREKQCCPFFDIALDIGARQRTLSLRVPEGAEEAMATLVAMLTP